MRRLAVARVLEGEAQSEVALALLEAIGPLRGLAIVGLQTDVADIADIADDLAPRIRGRVPADLRARFHEARPHSSYVGLTPDEVHAGERRPRRATERITYFDGRMHWYRFG